jgi:UrcA family protein
MPKRSTIFAAAAFSLGTIAVPALAQDYPPNTVVYNHGDEQIIVTAPRYSQRGDLGGEIRDIQMRREVRFDDLDLRTGWGSMTLKSRVKAAARSMCNTLDRMYPVATDDNPPCFRTAIDNAMPQVMSIIARARGL